MRGAGAASLVAAVAIVHLALIAPSHPAALTWGAFRLFPLELPLVLIVLVLAHGRAAQPLRLAVTGFLAAMTLVKAADFAAFSAYSRGFNLVLDLHLVPAAWHLGSGSVGVPLAAAAVLAAGLAAVLVVRLLWWATGRIARLAPARPVRRLAAVALVPAAVLVAADLDRSRFDPPGTAFTARLAREHAAKVAATRGDLLRFRAEAARDTFAAEPPHRLLAGLAGHDVLLVFVESYGRSSHQNPRYAGTIRPRLAGLEAELAGAGLAMRSAWLTAPMVGGQSWLAHASVLSGLWIDHQQRYQALVASPRRTLLHYAQLAGWRTVAVMPAMTLAWPEGDYFGYDATYAAADLGYRGLPFNWVTMPDQFTLAAFERLELDRRGRPPVFAEIALISSHAPWTPVPELVDWELIGDGRIFDEMAQAGDPPAVVWRDRDRVRDQYRQALDYALAAVGSFARRRAAASGLMVVLGDHEPAGFVAEIESFDVPVHLIGPPELVAAAEAWGWTAGLLPDPDAPVWPMDAFRDRFLAAFTAASGGPGGAAAEERQRVADPAVDPGG